MAVDAAFEILYVADSSEKQIMDIDYASVLVTYRNDFDMCGDGNLCVNQLFGNDSSLNNVDSMCWDYDSELFWTSSANGTQNGAVFLANLDTDDIIAETLAKNVKSSNGIAFFAGMIYYIDNNSSLF
jgi:sugar lactone lactonase YvrE